MKLMSNLIAIIFASFFVAVPGWADRSLTVFAAASLRDVMEEVASNYPSPVVISYGGSGLMARQVAAGAPADIIFLANAAWMDWLEETSAIMPESRRDMLGNGLVLVGSAGAKEILNVNAERLLEALAGGKLAMGNTSGVPAGVYGRQWLEASDMWVALEPHLAETENVRAALALVARGEAPMGVVYATDALADPAVSVVHRVDPSMHGTIRYPIAMVAGGREADAAGFLEFMKAPAQADIFRRHGFEVVGVSP